MFGDDGKCLDVAVDHGFFGQRRYITGIENMREAVTVIVAAAPDAIQLSVGHASLLNECRSRLSTALIVRTDIANVYGSIEPPSLYSHVGDNAVLQAVRLDAVCVVVNLLLIPGHPELERDCIRNVMRLRAACDKFGMPLMVEPLAMATASRGYDADRDPDKIIGLVRQAAELGADVIKADPPDPLDAFPDVLMAAGDRPVLVRGGARVSDEEILARTRSVMSNGAAGVVYGRNILQHRDPEGMTGALMAIIHADVSAEEALSALRARSRKQIGDEKIKE